MSSVKQKAIDLINSLPDTASTMDILESLIIKEKIETGLEDMKQGKTIETEELTTRLAEWRKSRGL